MCCAKVGDLRDLRSFGIFFLNIELAGRFALGFNQAVNPGNWVDPVAIHDSRGWKMGLEC